MTKYDWILVDYRREKAQKAMDAARVLLDTENLEASVNRVYYAVFYEVTALLLTVGLKSSKHSGIRSLFAQHFVKTGKVDKDLSYFYHKMFEYREKADYRDLVQFSKEEVSRWLEEAETFIVTLERLFSNVPKSEGT